MPFSFSLSLNHGDHIQWATPIENYRRASGRSKLFQQLSAYFFLGAAGFAGAASAYYIIQKYPVRSI
jgi:hypothetical protein